MIKISQREISERVARLLCEIDKYSVVVTVVPPAPAGTFFCQTKLPQLRKRRIANVVWTVRDFGPLDLPEVSKFLLNFWRQGRKLLLLWLLKDE